MKRLFLVLIIFLAAMHVYAGGKKEKPELLGKSKSTSEIRTEAAELLIKAQSIQQSDRKESISLAEKSAKLSESIDDFNMTFQAYYFIGLIHQGKRSILQPKAAINAFEKAKDFALKSRDRNLIMASYKRLAEEYAEINQSQTALSYYKKYTDLEENKIQLKALKLSEKLSESLKETKKDVEHQQDQIISLEEQKSQAHAKLDSVSAEKLQADLKLKTQEIEQVNLKVQLIEEKNKRNILVGGVIGTALLLIFMLYAFFQNKRTNRRLKTKNIEIEVEREKSDELLLNILPKPVATELKEHGKTTPRHYEHVTVLFTDFQAFTKISERLSPIELVNEIDFCFREFDKIIAKYNIEKIKTIGDAYMCVSGLPVPHPNHVQEILNASLEIRDMINGLAERRKEAKQPYFTMRIGVHTGPLVAGVVGSTKFVYDVWGDTVNTAARMEQNCEAGRINVSKEVHKLTEEQFIFTSRGSLEVKNKGNMEMYFLEARKAPVASPVT